MNQKQEPKYMIVDEFGRELEGAMIANRKTGKIIPSDEPIMIFRAQDRNTAQMQFLYAETCKNPGHQRTVMMRRCIFMAFQDNYPERVKEPD